MSAEQHSMSSEQAFLEQLSPGGGAARRPAEYEMEWGAFGPCCASQISSSQSAAPNEVRSRSTRPEPAFTLHSGMSLEPGCDAFCLDASCLDVGVMFDVYVPKGQNSLGAQSQGAQGGGDFADIVPLPGDWVALFLGDVSGQGGAAALAVPQALHSLRQLLRDSTGDFLEHSIGCPTDPAHTLNQLNRHLCGPALPAACASVSLSLAILNTKTGEAVCASAGSEPPLILRARGPIEAVSAGRVALGVEAGRTYHSVDFQLGKGDALLLATDGITKARNAGGGASKTALRYEGLAGLALEAFRLGGSPGRMARAVLSGARAFAGGTFHDHASVLVASRR